MRELSLSQKAKFLNALSQGLSVTKACEDAGIPRRTAYYWRSEDIEFKDAWEEAQAKALEELEDHLRMRAMDVSDPKSHILLIFLLKKLNPEYKENYKAPEKKQTSRPQEFEFSPDELDAAIGILEAAKSVSNRHDEEAA